VNSHPDPDTLAQLALQDMQNSQLEAAQAKCLQALTADRRHRLALTVLGLILHARARHDDAVRVFNALTLLEPNNAEHWTNLGTALRPTRRYDQALAAHNRALSLGPVSAGLLYNIGLLHMDRFEYDAAYGILTQAVSLAPSGAGVRCLFAQCCYDVGLFEDALATLEGWEKFQGLTAEVSAQIAYLLMSMGESRRAESALRKLAAGPRDGTASLAAVRVLERLNQLPEARATLERVKAAAGENHADLDLFLADAVLTQREGNYEAARELLALALKDHKDPARRYHLLYPLAKSLDTLGRYDEAYAALEEAHQSQAAYLQALTGKSPSDESATMSLSASGCDPADVARWDEPGTAALEASPIFIVGFPRSGTTLLEQTLDAHPGLKSMDEQPFLKKALDEVNESGIRYPAELAKLSAAELERIRAGYWERVRKKIDLGPGQRLVDKNPLNLLRLPLIRRLFPDARIVLAIRHPCDTVLSCFMQYFRAPDLALMCRDLPTLAGNYKRTFDFWYAQWPLLKPCSREIRYETFVADFDAEARRLSDFLQLPWDDAMLAPGEHARAKGFISTPSYSQVIEPINSRSVGHWKVYERHFAAALPILMPYIERWGYGA
jgi:tetratricopeptide (TPR) repeat protein